MTQATLAEPETRVARLTSEAEALAAARAFADLIAATAVERDRDFALAEAEAAALARSGLLAINVPREHGGADVSAPAMVRILGTIAAADPGIAQSIQPHLTTVEGSRLVSDAAPPEAIAARDALFAQVVDGALFGTAAVEREAATAKTVTTSLRRDAEGVLRLHGQKYYSTGSMFARWISVLAVDESGQKVSCLVDRKASGLHVVDDWRALGQRASTSGTTVFDGVKVEDGSVRPHVEIPPLLVPWSQLIHGAIDTGIARGAFDDMAGFARHHARPWVDAGVLHSSEETQVQELVGKLATRLEAAEAYLDHAARLTEKVRQAPDEDNVLAARLAVAGCKTFSTDVVLQITNELFAVGGTRAATSSLNLDRHWRNARIHTLHNPDRWLRTHIGNWLLNGVRPPDNGKI